MATTTIRVDTQTHLKLVELAAADGTSLMETTRAAAEALRRQRFAGQVAHELHALSTDPADWAEYLADAESTHTRDGLG
jgi:hypothetical protein